MTKTNRIPEGLSQADVDFLVANPGETLGGVVGGAPEAFKPSSSVDITNQRKGIRPQIKGNTTDVTGDRISRPSPGLAGRLAEGDARLRAEAAARKAEQEAQAALLDGDKINERICYLERALKRAEKAIKKLEGHTHDS